VAVASTAATDNGLTQASRIEPAVTATADVLIVGAGPTGLTLAARLQQFGVSVRIVDRQLDRVHESRALAMQPRTLEVLRGVGIAETLVERGNDAVQLRIHFGERIVGIRLFDIGLEDTAFPFLLFISQAETEAILNEHLAARGLPVERGVELVGFSSDSDGVGCMLRSADGGTEQVRCRCLVGCDGAHSTVREGAGIPFEGGTYPQTFVLADLELDGELERGAARMRSSAARGSCCSFRSARRRPGGSWACARAPSKRASATGRRSRSRSRSCSGSATGSRAARCACATRSG
jgi:2-polyprenyl-6-methoxyphenol hydroxylase-like FAD-dependent oxidoreductase